MNVVLFEGCRNARVDEVIQECLGTLDVEIVGYNSEGWYSYLAYIKGTENHEVDYDTVRRLHMAQMDMDDVDIPDLYDMPGYKWVPEEPVAVPTNVDNDPHNDLLYPVSIVGWVVGGSYYDEGEDIPPVDEDVYQA